MNLDDESARLALPLLHAGQAEKELDHNEALVRLDMTTQASVRAIGLNTPPDAAVPGQCWIVGDLPNGEWAGRANALAGWTAGGWRFVAAIEGMSVWDEATRTPARFRDAAWRPGEVAAVRIVIDGVTVLGRRRASIPMPDSGTTIDSEARTAIRAIIATLEGHGLIASPID